MAVLYVASYLFWPFGFDHKGIFLLVCWLVALVGLMALLIYDLRWMLLPNKIVFPLIALGVLQVLTVAIIFDGGIKYVVGAVVSAAIAGGIFYVLFQVSKGQWIGGGDVKLGYALGLLLAAPNLAFLMIFVASLLGILVAIPGLLTKKLAASSKIPFGPYLIAATVLVMLFGQSLVDWYNLHILLP